MDNSTIDPQVKNLVSAIGQAETGASSETAYSKKGASGEFGRYQFMPETYKLYAKKYLGDATAEPSMENQNKIAYSFVKEKKDSGFNPAQIASMWNAGEGKPNAYKENYRGVNSAGVYYDTPAYAQKVSNYYNELKGQSTSSDNSESFPLTSQEDVQKTQDQQPTDLTTSNGKGLGGEVLDVLGNVTGTQKLGQGLGYALSNALGSQDKVIEAQGNMQDTQTQLLQRIKEKKARGEDTTKLQGALDDLTKKIQEGAGNIENVGTGGISSGQVLGSALQTGATVLTAPSLIKAGLGVFGVGKTAAALGNAAPYVAQETGITEKVFSSLTRTEQLNLLGQTLKGAQLGDAEIISNAIKALQPTTGFLKGLIKNYAIPAGVAIVADRVLGSRLGSAAKTVTSGLIK